uniref:Beta-carotene isomerase D27-like C-terminal domain-containing protein n=1 Tax=Triticum urartu TaxID=4572 RepID=A0A8R7JWU0_TRIUA
MATPTTSRLHVHLLPALPSCPPRAPSSSAPSARGPSRRLASRLYCSSPPVEAPPSGKGGEYRPSFADDFLLAFFRAKMVETFFKDHMGVDLYMEPNFEDYSCQFNFGVPPPPIDTDKALKEPCLDICTNARRRREFGSSGGPDGLCPQEMVDEELTDIMVDMEFGELMKDWIEDWSDDENSDREDRSENGNEWDDLNIDELDNDQENNSELSNEDYISQFIFECHNAYDYYGESDTETGLNDESLDAPGSGQSESSVIMIEVIQDDGAKNVQDTASADDKRDMFMQIMEMTFTSHDA